MIEQLLDALRKARQDEAAASAAADLATLTANEAAFARSAAEREVRRWINEQTNPPQRTEATPIEQFPEVTSPLRPTMDLSDAQVFTDD